jgi:hypothetical protein
MTLSTPTPWTDLLSHRFSDVNEEYGPNSHMVVSALEALDETKWLQRVGEPWLERAGESLSDSRVTVVRSWAEALTIFGNRPRYNINGVLEAPCARVDDVFARLPEREDWWQKAREEAKRYTALSGWAPKSLAQEQRDLIFEHLWEFVSMLLAEIIASPEAECTYFREQLPWFHAGHFPSGWDGDWPSGHMRVY